MFGNIGMGELIVIAVVVMILFGANKLPEFTKSLGVSAKEFRKALKEDDEETDTKAVPVNKVTSKRKGGE